MPNKRTTERVASLSMFSGVLLICALSWYAYSSAIRFIEASRSVAQARLTIMHIERAESSKNEAVAANSRYTATREPQALEDFTRADAMALHSLDALRPLLSGDADELKLVDRLTEEYRTSSLEMAKENKTASAANHVSRLDRLKPDTFAEHDPGHAMLQGLVRLEDSETRVLEAREEVLAHTGRRIVWMVMLYASLALLGLLVFGTKFIRNRHTRTSAQKALAKAEAQMAMLLENSSDMIVVLTPDATIQFVSPAVTRIFGHNPEDLVGKNIFSFVHPDDLALVKQRMAETLTLGKTNSLAQIRLANARNGFTDVETISRRLPSGMIVVDARDITIRVNAQKALEEAERHFRTLLQHSNDIVAIVESDGTIRFVNSAVKAALGCEASDVIGQNLFTHIHPDDLAAARESMSRTVLNGEKPESHHMRMRSASGEYVWMSVLSNNLLADPDLGAIVINARDITERKRTEEALAETEENFVDLFENADELIHSLAPDGRFRYANPAWRKQLGYSEAQLKKMTIFDVLAPSERERSTELFQRLKAGEHIPEVRTKFISSDGREIDVEGYVNWKRVDGVPVYTRAMFRDVTRRREIDRMKDEFISVVSHELRTPLTSIRGSLGLLVTGLLKDQPDKAHRMMEIALKNTERLTRLINDILDIERIESGKAALSLEEVSTTQLVQEAVDTIKPLAASAGISVELNVSPVAVYVDRDRIIQTLTNLLSNAVKFSAEGTTITVSTRAVNGSVTFQVKDQGRGIPQNKLQVIFGRFQQIDASDSREKGGTGLGLAICRSIVQQHEGRIWAESTLGNGSTFTFELPRCKTVAIELR